MDRKRLPFCRALSACGFNRADTTRDPLTYERRIGDRTVSVQLWRDGLYRASHAVHRQLPGTAIEGRHGCTLPTVFKTVPQMHAAILTEIGRTDHGADIYGYPPGLGAGWRLVLERRRQVEVEGWSADHDDGHDDGALAHAAACYAVGSNRLSVNGPSGPAFLWPWRPEWWKPRDQRRNLVRAGALVIAELERLDRQERRADDAAWAAQSGRAS